MGYWPKARKDIQEVLERFDRASDPNYAKNAIAWLERQTCYQERGNR